MIIRIDPSSGVPPYDQVRSAIERAVADGTLGPGSRLPTVRALAANLGLAPNTVARAYRELEALGVVHSQGRRGTFVADPAPASAGAARAAADAYAARARDLGLTPEAALRLVRAALEL
ncbi:MAG TPA: GntR family transcriptional regulator [Acidimicrobiales bacterium]